jgi:hypothetical protein
LLVSRGGLPKYLSAVNLHERHLAGPCAAGQEDLVCTPLTPLGCNQPQTSEMRLVGCPFRLPGAPLRSPQRPCFSAPLRRIEMGPVGKSRNMDIRSWQCWSDQTLDHQWSSFAG